MRRWPFVLVIFVFFSGLASVPVGAHQTSSTGGSVPMFRGGPARTGENPGPGPRARPSVRWKTQLGLLINGSPAVVDGVVYVGAVAPTIRAGDALYAIDAARGDIIWRLPTVDGDGFLSSPAVANGIVYIGSYYGIFLAADATTGDERWRFQATAAILASPVVTGDLVYAGDDAGNLYALDTETGELRWQLNSDRVWERSYKGSPAVVDGTVYVINSPRREGVPARLIAVDGETGVEQWRFTPAQGGLLRGTPAVVDGSIYVTTNDGFLYAVDTTSGREQWHLEIPGPVQYTNPAVVNSVIYFANGNGELHAIDIATRAQRWSQQLARNAAFYSSPVVAGDAIYLADTNGTVYAIDTASGDKRWQINARSLLSSPAVVDGMIYIGSEVGELVALGDPIDNRFPQPPDTD